MYPNNTNPQPEGQWSSGLCDCFQDSSNCCVTCCCPCITFGRVAEIVDRGQTTCASGGLTYYALAHLGCACLYTCTYRPKLRALYSLPEDPCGDCCVHFWCTTCALCQEYRELKSRGVDPTIGWVANAQKMNGEATTPPFVAPGMTR
ncbi:cell number regulator 2-like [Corylus avellana]|uniref:cell number regulator 2-like n=1 Tax=Corylus avellana TaxID=13451 RepID=UPI001E201367|nr:cell number regulator 2-like [Corylus avellana]